MEKSKKALIAIYLAFLVLASSELRAQLFGSAPAETKIAAYFVKAENLNLRAAPSMEGEVIHIWDNLEKLVILRRMDRPVDSSWVKVVYPKHGFVYGEYLYSEKEIDSVFYSDRPLRHSILQSMRGYGFAVKEVPDDPEDLEPEEGPNYRSIVSLTDSTYLEINKRDESISSDCVFQTYWWNDKDADTNLLPGQSELFLKIYRNNNCERDAFARVYYREYGSDNFELYEETEPFSISDDEEDEIDSWIIGNLDHGNYSFKIEFFDQESGAFYDVEHFYIPHLEWKVFEYEPIVLDDFYQVSLMGVFAPASFPIEKNFKNYKFPFGANLEVGHTLCDFSAGLGFNMMQAENIAANDNRYLLKTQTYYLYIKYSVFTLFEKSLDFFVNIGGSYWKSSFQNVEYPTLSEYHLEYTSDGFNVLAGGGMAFYYRNFFAGVQYQFYNTPFSKYGKVPSLTEFENYYELYTGSHQIQLFLGYRLQF